MDKIIELIAFGGIVFCSVRLGLEILSLIYLRFFSNSTSNQKIFNKKIKEVELMKKNGELHNWVELELDGNTYRICDKTGWCPSRNCFFDVKTVIKQLSLLKIQREFQESLNTLMKTISTICNLSLEDGEKMYKEFRDIISDFPGGTKLELYMHCYQKKNKIAKKYNVTDEQLNEVLIAINQFNETAKCNDILNGKINK